MRYTFIVLSAIITLVVCGCNTIRPSQRTETEQLKMQIASLSNKVECLNQQLKKTRAEIEETKQMYYPVWRLMEENVYKPVITEQLQSVSE